MRDGRGTQSGVHMAVCAANVHRKSEDRPSALLPGSLYTGGRFKTIWAVFKTTAGHGGGHGGGGHGGSADGSDVGLDGRGGGGGGGGGGGERSGCVSRPLWRTSLRAAIPIAPWPRRNASSGRCRFGGTVMDLIVRLRTDREFRASLRLPTEAWGTEEEWVQIFESADTLQHGARWRLSHRPSISTLAVPSRLCRCFSNR